MDRAGRAQWHPCQRHRQGERRATQIRQRPRYSKESCGDGQLPSGDVSAGGDGLRQRRTADVETDPGKDRRHQIAPPSRSADVAITV